MSGVLYRNVCKEISELTTATAGSGRSVAAGMRRIPALLLRGQERRCSVKLEEFYRARETLFNPWILSKNWMVVRKRLLPVLRMIWRSLDNESQRDVQQKNKISSQNIMEIENPLTFAQGLRYNGRVKEQC